MRICHPPACRHLSALHNPPSFARFVELMERKIDTKEQEAGEAASTSASFLPSATITPPHPPDYGTWPHARLVARISELEFQVSTLTLTTGTRKPGNPGNPGKPGKPSSQRRFDPSRYSSRLVALKLAYLGQRYNGFEHHANSRTPLPTVEEELWKALWKARLIFPTGEGVNWEGCEYSKCGRTDKGVSAFGQVIGVRVRSNRPLEAVDEEGASSDGSATSEPAAPTPPFDPVADELPYTQMLNRLLPADIRVLAWCPSPPANFSARFSCRERRYRYFFTQPAYSPVPGSPEGWLDITAMRDGARRFEGLHDFRNFCKVDAAKQISNFERRIFHSDIEEVKPSAGLAFLWRPEFSGKHYTGGGNADDVFPKVYTFTLHGSAFLWHQVRHMVAVLFLVGQGLEAPSVVSELLDVERSPCRPLYEMATDAPLVLWDCIFPRDGDAERKESLEWIYVGEGESQNGGAVNYARYGHTGIVELMWKYWRKRKMDEVLAGSLLDLVVLQGPHAPVGRFGDGPEEVAKRTRKIFDGGDAASLKGLYVPIMKKPRMESVEVINARYAEKKGLNKIKDDGNINLG
ncbi:MAG: hypothetical protein M1829_003931 [Trizodia sp. TS-e1964]|nr:MAG: hypothetical protein M1829_003931 [Trizodia sp. TS-e1964]